MKCFQWHSDKTGRPDVFMFSENSFFKLFFLFSFFSLCTLVEQAVKTMLKEWAAFKKTEIQRIWNRKDFSLDILSQKEIIIYWFHYISCLVISSNICPGRVEKWISVVSYILEKIINYETVKKNEIKLVMNLQPQKIR